MAGRVVVVGATGQIGRPLCRELALTGHAVSVFSRDPDRARPLVPGAADYLEWNPGNLLTAQCTGHLAAADAVVYLAGGALFDGRRHSRAGIETESRTRASALGHLVAALGGLDRRPGALIAASSVGYYGFAGHSDQPTDESSPNGKDWWGADCAAIEQAALSAGKYGVHGPVNLTAPEPARTRQFARALGRVLSRRAWLPVPAPFVRMGLGPVTDILTRGKRVLPAKATAAGYRFRFPDLDPALRDIVDGEPFA